MFTGLSVLAGLMLIFLKILGEHGRRVTWEDLFLPKVGEQKWVIRELCWMIQEIVCRAFFSRQRIYLITGTYSTSSKVMSMNVFQ
ncbi:hypothetical protein APT61_11855 [Leclercia adecarboxylata]|nr:hypothetical protein APT61_11855 [Leclercia adecarboxylata]